MLVCRISLFLVLSHAMFCVHAVFISNQTKNQIFTILALLQYTEACNAAVLNCGSEKRLLGVQEKLANFTANERYR